MAEPPLCKQRELEDGTYTLDDVLDMIIRMLWKADQTRKSHEAVQAQTQQQQRFR